MTLKQKMYVTDKPIDSDQLQDILKRLLADEMISESAPLTNILKTYDEYTRNPNKKFINKKYNTNTGLVEEGEIHRFNFAVDYVAILKDKNEIYFLLDNSKVVCIYEYNKGITSTDVYLNLISYLDQFGIECFIAEDTEEIETYVGIKSA